MDIKESQLSLVSTSDVSGIVSGFGIARTLRSSGNRNDVSRSGGERKRKHSDPSDSDSVEFPIPIATRFFDLHWNGKAPYASDSDSASDAVDSGNQPFRIRCY